MKATAFRLTSFTLFLTIWFTTPTSVFAESGTYSVTKQLWSYNQEDSPARVMEFTTEFEVTGLWGPIPAEAPSLTYLNETYTPEKQNESWPQPDEGPFVRIEGYQLRNQPITIRVSSPPPEKLGTITSADSGVYQFFRPTRLRVFFRQVVDHDFFMADFDQHIDMKKDELAGTISWTPKEYAKQERVVTAAPVVIEVIVEYSGVHGMIVDGNPDANWEEETTRSFRVGWLTLPVCGSVTGDNLVRCPDSTPAIAAWRSRNLGDISIAVPDNWRQDLSPDKDQWRWEIDSAKPLTAGLMLARDVQISEFLDNMENISEAAYTINNLDSTRYQGRIPKRNLDAVLYVLNRKDTQGRQITIGAVAADWDSSGPLLEDAVQSLSFGPQDQIPEVPADLSSDSSGQQLLISAAAPSKTSDTLPTLPEQTAAAGQTAEKLSLEEQQTLASELFQKMIDTPEDDFDTFIRLYQEVMDRCPDTEQAEVSYWRLSNLYLLGFDPPQFEQIVSLFETFLQKYRHKTGISRYSQLLPAEIRLKPGPPTKPLLSLMHRMAILPHRRKNCPLPSQMKLSRPHKLSRRQQRILPQRSI